MSLFQTRIKKKKSCVPAKKRKASKKKKNGNGITKPQRSISGEASSSKGHHKHQEEQNISTHQEEQYILTHQEEQYISTVSENIPMNVLHNGGKDFGKVVENDVGGILCVRDMNVDRDYKSKDKKVFHIESAKKLHNSDTCNYETPASEKCSLVSEDHSLTGEAYKPVVETKNLDVIVSLENSANSNVVEMGSQANDARLVPSSVDVTDDSATVIDTESKNEDSCEENGGKILHALDDPVPEISTSVDHVKDSESVECDDEELQVYAARRQVQTTSWKNCCGLFEVLMGSN